MNNKLRYRLKYGFGLLLLIVALIIFITAFNKSEPMMAVSAIGIVVLFSWALDFVNLKSKKHIEYLIILEQAGDVWQARIPDLKGAYVTGSDRQEVIERVKELGQQRIDYLREQELDLPTQVWTAWTHSFKR